MIVRGTSVDIATRDGTADAYLAYPDDAKPHPAVLFYMDVFGVRPHLKRMAALARGEPRGGQWTGRSHGLLHGRQARSANGRYVSGEDRGRSWLPWRAAGDRLTGQPAPAGIQDHRNDVFRPCRRGYFAASRANQTPRRGSHWRGREISSEVYAGASHGFTQADTTAYHPEAAERHWTALLDLFDRAL